jgi:small subunit ribosomal protein S20
LKSAVKRAGTADAATAPALLAAAMKRIDKAAKTNVIHKNAAARQKSRLAKRMAAAAAK